MIGTEATSGIKSHNSSPRRHALGPEKVPGSCTPVLSPPTRTVRCPLQTRPGQPQAPGRGGPADDLLNEYASFLRRVIHAHARRVAAGDADALADMTRLATELDEAISQAVAGLRGAGYF